MNLLSEFQAIKDTGAEEQKQDNPLVQNLEDVFSQLSIEQHSSRSEASKNRDTSSTSHQSGIH